MIDNTMMTSSEENSKISNEENNLYVDNTVDS